MQKYQQKTIGKKAIILRLIAICAVFTAVICVMVYLDYTQFQASLYAGSDPNSGTLKKANWAQPLEVPGLPNFHKVSDDLYRGAQPTAEGMIRLKELGIKTVVNLRSMHSDRDEIGKTKLTYEHINMTTLNFRNEDAVRFLQIVTDSNCTPVFVHCQHGADRTGTMCALYRIAVLSWSKDEAIEEMIQGGFGFHSIWKNLVDYILELDIDKIKQSSGLIE